LTATVKSLGRGARTPAGSITFWDGSLILGTQVVRRGKASLKTTNLLVGANNIHADYLPSQGFVASAGAIIEIVRVRPAKSKPAR
jgi:hypothetical protein